MAESSGSPHRLLYKQVGSPHWKETFRQREALRMYTSREIEVISLLKNIRHG
uniref:RPA interacting protein n=1 Tax=Mus musculus TaxID=10090 RepID=J3QP63_MOUSE